MSGFVQWCIDHKVPHTLAVLWAMALITWVVLRAFADLSLISGAVASALTAVVGLLSVLIGRQIPKYNRY
ncbi:MAG TPA: hypothetical protein VFM97_00240 [Gammaproteobacteria bacterium]|nr:hypothetical protein [Gammaproteobacteria bacterium]